MYVFLFIVSNIIYKILQIPGLVNVDFADVKAVMKNSGTAMLGVGVSSSKNRAQEAAEQATLAPLIGSSIESATGVVYNITGGKDITLQEVNKVSQVRIFPMPKKEKYFVLAQRTASSRRQSSLSNSLWYSI